MYATITIRLGSTVETRLIHSSAVSELDGGSMVFVYEKDTRFRVRRVKLGRQTGSLTEIVEGLSPGEKVVREGGFLLKSELLKGQVSE
jgi:cobalt-zinc-cadmium efflux system membrane fusion protein